jgi:hypothetical protein
VGFSGTVFGPLFPTLNKILFDNRSVLSPAGSPAALANTGNLPFIRQGQGIWVRAAGTGANNANAKTVSALIGTYTTGPVFSVLTSTAFPINALVPWFFDLMLLPQEPEPGFQGSGPWMNVSGVCVVSGVVPTACDTNIAGAPPSLGSICGFQCTQVAAADVIQHWIYAAIVSV